MTTFLDGAAKDVVLHLQRSPLLLRVVVSFSNDDSRDGGAKWDALDQLDDEPQACEEIYVYRLCREPGVVCIDGTDKRGRRKGWREPMAEYALNSVQPLSENELRFTKDWREWCQQQPAGFAEVRA